MAYKTVMTVVSDPALDKSSLEAAIAFATMNEAHLEIVCIGIDRTQPGFYYAGANAMIIQDNLAQAQEETAEIETAVKHRMAAEIIPWGTITATTQLAGLTPFVAQQTRYADIVLVPKPYGTGRGHEEEAIVEAILFGGNTPVLVVPDGHDLSQPFRRVIAAWNESAEAMHAIRAAIPTLQRADFVDVAIIDPPQHGPDRSDPGGVLSQMLARHGVRAQVSVLARTMPRISDVLCRHAEDCDADLIVMGAYGHSRFRESILGGATRNMLAVSDIPVFMVH